MIDVMSISRSYAILAPLEKLGSDIWADQYQMTIEDAKALEQGYMTDRMYQWYQNRYQKNQQLLKQVM